MKKESIIKLLEIEETVKHMQMSINPRGRESYLATYNRLYSNYMELKREFTHDYNIRIDWSLKDEIINQISEESEIDYDFYSLSIEGLKQFINNNLINNMIARLQNY